MVEQIIAVRCRYSLKRWVSRRVFRQRHEQLMLAQASRIKSAILVI
jgi:hypothetical protein